jgi:exopolysaccharide biosynthesis polyprenyl glycosylphosphotransferase
MFPPRKMLLISGKRSDYHLVEKINSREDKYVICQIMNIEQGLSALQQEILNYDGVIIGDISSHERNLLLKHCFANSIRTYNVPKISDILLKSSVELNLFDSPLYLSRNEGMTIEQQFFKRVVDVIGSLAGIVVSSPLFIVIGLSIKLTDRGSIFFKQTRLTKDDQVFEIYKFRTMIQNAEKDDGPRLAAEGDSRILPVGHLLRRTRLDELPQLFNILKGEMSFVGPRPERPELAEEIIREIPEFSYRTKVKAGLTGYAQIYGKYNTTSYDKLKLDLTYIRNYSFLLDLKLILMTPKIMFMKESAEGILPDAENQRN